jgi:hypothetical protein
LLELDELEAVWFAAELDEVVVVLFEVDELEVV